ncbi:MAG TPA: nucleoside transporter C-terminal domain-containing protein [Phycisphaerae bacterium]|nr:nucleoside transporter C-terminal domain-containing protein [Phycisphaerae bacterium]
MAVLRALLGVAVLCSIAWGLSGNRRRIPWRTVLVGIGLQVVLALFILRSDPGIWIFAQLTALVAKLLQMTNDGTALVFGPLSDQAKTGFVLAIALCTIIFFSALMAILYFLGVMQTIIWLLARFMSYAMGVSGAESMAMAANIFVGQTEAGLTVKQYIPRMTRSELNSLMTGGFATMAAGMIAIYTGLMGQRYGTHILAAEVLSAPAAFVIAKLMRPETEEPETGSHFPLTIDRGAHNILEATANGTRDGLYLFLNVVAMLISFGALVALINWPLGVIGEKLHIDGVLDLGRIFGWLLSPIAWVIGITDWGDCQRVGGVLGIKVATNEFFGFLRLSRMTPEAAATATQPAAFGYLSERASILATYAICDFANFVSIGIQIGGFTPMAPERKTDFASLAFRAMIGGCLASWMTAAIAGMFV